MEAIVLQQRLPAVKGDALAALAELCRYKENEKTCNIREGANKATDVKAASSSQRVSNTPASATASPQQQNMVREILSASLSLATLSKSPVLFKESLSPIKAPVVKSPTPTFTPISPSSPSSSSSSSSSSEPTNQSLVSIQPRLQTPVLPNMNFVTMMTPVVSPSLPPAVSKPPKRTPSSTTTATNSNSHDAERIRFREYQVTTWSRRLQEVQDFVQKHKHCMIPSDYPPNQKLAKWAKRQRCQYQLYQSNPSKSSMTQERIRVLEDLGFCWQNKMSVWQSRYQELLQFHLQFGHTQVPSSYKPNQRLATWVKCQRRQKRLRDRGKPSSMTADRIALLDSVNFVWRMYPSNPRED